MSTKPPIAARMPRATSKSLFTWRAPSPGRRRVRAETSSGRQASGHREPDEAAPAHLPRDRPVVSRSRASLRAFHSPSTKPASSRPCEPPSAGTRSGRGRRRWSFGPRRPLRRPGPPLRKATGPPRPGAGRTSGTACRRHHTRSRPRRQRARARFHGARRRSYPPGRRREGVRRFLLPLLAVLVLATPAGGARSGGAPVALVTAETLNQLIAVELPSGRVLRRISLPEDPENVEAQPGLRIAVVVSTRAGVVSLVDTERLRVIRKLGGFRSPHIAALPPDGEYAYVTDDGSGKLNVIDLARRRVIRRVFVGIEAHHLAISPDGRRTWVALGEHARSIVILNTSNPLRPRVIGRFEPGGEAHDLAFTPSGARVWVTWANTSQVGIFDARSHRLVRTFSAGSPPQHVASLYFEGRGRMYVTSGYAGRMEIRDAESGRPRHSAGTAYGSFNIGLGGGLLLTSSLERGTLTELDNVTGRRLGQWHVAPAARDVALVVR